MKNTQSLQWLFAGLSGGLFGVGLVVSEMSDPIRVLGFLTLTAEWDPTLMWVMIGALLVTLPGFQLLIRKQQRPIADDQFHLPESNTIDGKLLAGATIFGAGWGLAGYCPGPALVNLVINFQEGVIFCLAMVLGVFAAKKLK